jgi:hypothetical protein
MRSAIQSDQRVIMNKRLQLGVSLAFAVSALVALPTAAQAHSSKPVVVAPGHPPFVPDKIKDKDSPPRFSSDASRIGHPPLNPGDRDPGGKSKKSG